MFRIHLLVIIVIWGVSVYGQQPDWTRKMPKSGNSTYYYEMAKGFGRTIDEAKEKMYFDIKSNIAEKLGVPSEVKISSSSQMSSSGEMYLKIENSIDGSLPFTIPMRRVCDHAIHLKDGTWVSYGLYQVAQYGNINVDFSSYTKCYKMSSNYAGLWRSTIVPGWGQFFKGEKVKGFFFMGSEAALIGTAFYFHNEYQTDFKKSQETTNIEIQKAYRDKADINATYRNVAIIGAVSVYVWNLVDALSNNSDRSSNNVSKNFIFEIDNEKNIPLLGYTFRF